MKPIWYFVGLILMVIGVLIFAVGIFQAINPPDTLKILSDTHPGIWWGAVMAIFGTIMFLKTRNTTV